MKGADLFIFIIIIFLLRKCVDLVKEESKICIMP